MSICCMHSIRWYIVLFYSEMWSWICILSSSQSMFTITFMRTTTYINRDLNQPPLHKWPGHDEPTQTITLLYIYTMMYIFIVNIGPICFKWLIKLLFFAPWKLIFAILFHFWDFGIEFMKIILVGILKRSSMMNQQLNWTLVTGIIYLVSPDNHSNLSAK